MSKPDTGAPRSSPEPGERLPLARRMAALSAGPNRRKLFIGLALAALAVPVVVGSMLWISSTRQHASGKRQPSLADAQKAFDAHDDERARWLALVLASSPRLAANERFWPPLLLARLAQRKAEQLSGNDQVRQNALAARYFAQAAARGVPRTEEAACLLGWGKCLYLSGQPDESAKILDRALHAPDCNLDEARLLLARARLEQANPDLPAALGHVVELLKSTRLPAASRDIALALAADIDYRLGHYPEALARLDALSKPVAVKQENRLLRGQVLVARARQLSSAGAKAAEQAEAWQAALAWLRPLAADNAVTDSNRAGAGYLIGLCYAGLGQQRKAADAWAEEHHGHPFAQATLAARFELAELRQREGNDDQAAVLFREAARQMEDEESENPWLARQAARQRVIATHQRLLEQHKFVLAQELGQWFEELFDENERTQLDAQLHAAWGAHLQEQADSLAAGEAAGAHERAREQRIQAGDAYRRLAQLHYTTRQYAELVLLSAQNYAAGHAYSDAVQQWRTYLEVELRQRRGEALLELGRALLARGEPEEALLSLDDCIELDPTGVSSFEARLLAAEAYIELRDPARAEQVLQQTLNSDVLKPVSQEWRQALYALAKLLYQTGRLSEARVRLEEVVQRYPDAAFNTEARYLLAATCWKLALAAEKDAADKETAASAPAPAAAKTGIETPGPSQPAAPSTAEAPPAKQSETTANVAVPPIEQLLATAGSQYAAVATALAKRQEEAPLSPWEAALLRNSYFGQGAVLFRQQRYDHAIQAYLAVVNRYYTSPEVLEAYTQIYACYRRLGRPAEAKDALLLARAALAQLPADASFTETTNYTRVQWGELFDSLARL